MSLEFSPKRSCAQFRTLLLTSGLYCHRTIHSSNEEILSASLPIMVKSGSYVVTLEEPIYRRPGKKLIPLGKNSIFQA
jgi:hypothetical protein